jgi:thiol-disulfide isomerase/thioredoxin
MMINRLSLFLIFTLAISGCKNSSVQITGKLQNPVKGGYLYLEELKANELAPVDSLKIGGDGKFSFNREAALPTFFLLKTSNSNFFTTLIEPGEKLRIEAIYDSLNNPSSVSGSKGTEKMVAYNKALKNTVSKLMSLNEIYTQNASNPDLPKVIQSLDSTAQQYLKEINVYTKKYIDENIKSLISLVALYQQVAPQIYVLDPVKDIKYFVKVDSSLYSRYPESAPVKALHEQVQGLISRTGATAIFKEGDPVPEISLPAVDGKIVSLTSTRGNIVLLDFWASWCNPCRLESPNLVKAFNLYHGKGFKIFQVSLDKTKDDWLKGIKDDNLSQWIHVSDLKYWNSVVVPLYKIESIPYSLLLDNEGKVIASNLRGEELQKKLAELYK